MSDMNTSELAAKVREAVTSMHRKSYELDRKIHKFSYTADELISVYDKSLGNAASVLSDRNQRCACFACKRIFPASEIRDCDVFDDNAITLLESDCKQTVLCPHCRTDAVLCEKDVKITEQLVDDLNVLSGLRLVAKFEGTL